MDLLGRRVASIELLDSTMEQNPVPRQCFRRRYPEIDFYEEKHKDKVRNSMYQSAIEHHKDSIKDKVVLDLGCSAGILAILCTKKGASKVYAVVAGTDLDNKVADIVEENGLSHVIEVLSGPFEDVEIDEEVDVIVSEWMGQMLIGQVFYLYSFS